MIALHLDTAAESCQDEAPLQAVVEGAGLAFSPRGCEHGLTMRVRNVLSRESQRLLMNMVKVRPAPLRGYRGIQIARGAVGRGAMQKRSELAPFLAVVLKEQPRTVVEIGLGAGGMLWALCQVATADATIVSVDLPGGAYGGDISANVDHDRLSSYARRGQAFHLIQADSHDPSTAETVREIVEAADLLFIDGDHTYEGVAADYRLYAPLVRPGGLVAFHDILPVDNLPDCQVHRFWAELPDKKTEITSPFETNAFFGGRWGGIGFLRHQLTPNQQV